MRNGTYQSERHIARTISNCVQLCTHMLVAHQVVKSLSSLCIDVNSISCFPSSDIKAIRNVYVTKSIARSYPLFETKVKQLEPNRPLPLFAPSMSCIYIRIPMGLNKCTSLSLHPACRAEQSCCLHYKKANWCS